MGLRDWDFYDLIDYFISEVAGTLIFIYGLVYIFIAIISLLTLFYFFLYFLEDFLYFGNLISYINFVGKIVCIFTYNYIWSISGSESDP